MYNPYTNTNDYPDWTSYPILGNPWAPAPLGIAGSIQRMYEDVVKWQQKYNVPQAAMIEFQNALNQQTIDVTKGSDVQNFWQRMKDKYKQVSSGVSTGFGKITDTIKNVGENIGNAASNMWDNLKAGIDSAGITVLLPFKFAMYTALKRKGQPVSLNDSLPKITMMFYDAIVKNKSTFDYSFYERLNSIDAEAAQQAWDALPPEQKSSIIAAVIDFIRGLMNKRQSGAQLTPDEESILNSVDKGLNGTAPDGSKPSSFDGLLKAAGIGIAIWGAGKFIFKWW